MVERLTVDQVVAGSTPVTHPELEVNRLEIIHAGFFISPVNFWALPQSSQIPA